MSRQIALIALLIATTDLVNFVNCDEQCVESPVDGGIFLNCSRRGLTKLVLNRNDVQVLDVSDNAISNLNEITLTMSNLAQLDLSRNPFGASITVAHQPIALHALVKLRMTGNGIKLLPPTFFADLPLLQELDLSGNELSTIHFTLPVSIRLLTLDSNPIKVIGKDDFRNLNSLEVLRVSNLSGLEQFEAQSLYRLPQLVTLVATDNNMRDTEFLYGERLDIDLPHYPKLKNVELSNNRLTNLANGSIPWRNLDQLKLQNNPLLCGHYDLLPLLQSKANGWTYTCADIDKNCDGKPYAYGADGYWSELGVFGRRHLGWTIGGAVFLLVLMLALLMVGFCWGTSRGRRRSDSGAFDNEMTDRI